MEQPRPLTDDELEATREVVNHSISLVALANIAPRLLATVDEAHRKLARIVEIATQYSESTMYEVRRIASELEATLRG